MKLIIDRFEGGFAICENEETEFVQIKKDVLPADAMEGNVIEEQNGTYVVLKGETVARKENIKKMMDNLWRS